MKKRWFLTLIFPFLWVFLSGFGPPQDQQVEKIVKSDSTTTVKLQFENPRLDLVVRDQRNIDAVEKIITKIEDSDNAVATAISDVANGYLPYVIENQERRYESALDYLERVTDYPATEIENFIKQKRLSEMISSIVLVTSIFLSLCFLLSRVYVDKYMSWQTFLTKMLGLFVLVGLLYLTTETFINTIIFPDSYRFFTLINLSG